MDIKAWFSEYLDTHRPEGAWSLQADWAVRVCLRLWKATGEEKYRAYVIAWADSLIASDGCQPECGKALFFALDQKGEEKYRDAIMTVMADLGRTPSTAVLPAETLYAELPFRMAYEMKLGGMEKVGLAAAAFCRAHEANWNGETGLFAGDLRQTAKVLLALTDAIDVCADQLYEHWRAMVDLYREELRGALRHGAAADTETEAMLLRALQCGVEMGLIDPERYLPLLQKRAEALEAAGCRNAAAMLMVKGGAL